MKIGSDDITRYIRHCEREIQSLGYTLDRPRMTVTTHEFPSDDIRWRVWLAESLARALSRYAAGSMREAMRGLLQAREYRGRIGGWTPVYMSDTLHALQLALEFQLSEMLPFRP